MYSLIGYCSRHALVDLNTSVLGFYLLFPMSTFAGVLLFKTDERPIVRTAKACCS